MSKRYVFWLAVWALVYYGVARASLLLAIPGSNASPVWPPSGLALALLLIGGKRWAPAILVGAFAANLQGFASHAEPTPVLYAASLAIALGNTLEAIAATWALRKIAGAGLLWGRMRDAIGFAVIAPVACAISAAVGVSSLVLAQVIPSAIVGAVAQTWWLGDLCGMLVLAPFLVSWYPTVTRRAPTYPMHTRVGREVWVVLLGVAGAVGLVFATPFATVAESRPYVLLLFPLLGLIAWRYGLRGVSAAMVAVVGMAVVATLNGRGLLEVGPLQQVLVQLNILLVLLAAMSLLVVSDTTEQYLEQAAQEGENLSWRAQRKSWIALCVASSLSVMAWHLVAQSNENQAKQRFDAEVQGVVGRLNERVRTYQQVLVSGGALFIERNAVAPSTWRDFAAAKEINVNLPGIQGLGFAEWIAPNRLEAVQRRMRQESFDAFTVRPAGVREEYTSIVMLEPLNERNQRAVGFDMWSEPTRRAAMRLARDTGQFATTARVKLLQENGEDEQAGFLMYHPVYRGGTYPQTAAQRQQQLLGFVYAPFRASDFVNAALGKAHSHVWLEIADAGGDGGAQAASRLYPAPGKPGEPQTVQIGKLEATFAVDVGQHVWTVRVATVDGFWAELDATQSKFILVAGLLLSAFLFVLVRLQEQTHKKAQALANHMTQAYQNARSSLESLVSTASVAVVVADPDGTVQSWNPAAQHMFGHVLQGPSVPLQQLVAPVDGEGITQALQAWAHSTEPARTRLQAMALHDSGSRTKVNVSLSSWGAGAQRMVGAIFHDISEQQRAEEFERGLFEEALDAILIVQAGGRIVRANNRAAEVLGYAREVLETMQIENLVPLAVRHQHAARRANYAHSPSRRAMGGTRELHALHAQGHEVPVEISLNTMLLGDAVHYVATLVDISARKAAETRLQASLAFQDSVQRNAGVSIIATDVNGLILNFNSAAERMLGYTADEMVGLQTPAVIHDLNEVVARAAVLSNELAYPVEPGFEAFVARARLRQVDEREWTYIRKNGERIPVHLSITGLFDHEGALTGFLGIAADMSDIKRHEQTMQASLLEKETLLREVYHRVKNNLQVVGSLFNLQLRGMPKGPAHDALFEASQRVQSMALVHEKLYQSSTLSSIRLNDYVQDLCRQLMHVNGAEMRGITLTTQLVDVPLGLDQAVPLGLLINELLTNSIKHAFGHQGGVLHISIQCVNDHLELEIADNGKGFSNLKTMESGRSLGLRLARTLTRQLDGTIVRENRHGAYTRVSFPMVQVTATTRGV